MTCLYQKVRHFSLDRYESSIHILLEVFLTHRSLIATVQKIVTEILPPSSGLVFGKDARDLLIECCVEFITLISSEANDISEKESKKTIACDHITKALEQLGFGAYVQEIMEVANEHKEQLKVCPLRLFSPEWTCCQSNSEVYQA
jgi:histone H3/H4